MAAKPTFCILLPDAAHVIRLGEGNPYYMKLNADTHRNDVLAKERRHEWALSIASSPDASVEEICQASVGEIRGFENYRQMRLSTAGRLRAKGYPVFLDRPPHGLIILPSDPSEDTCVDVIGCFDPSVPNPVWKGRP